MSRRRLSTFTHGTSTTLRVLIVSALTVPGRWALSVQCRRTMARFVAVIGGNFYAGLARRLSVLQREAESSSMRFCTAMGGGRSGCLASAGRVVCRCSRNHFREKRLGEEKDAQV